jgi:eukaryotic-like serine/threonine-protein kinase
LAVPRPHIVDTLAPGQRIGPFVLLAPLGTGGSGRVWAVARAGQLGFTKRMALKVMRQDKVGSDRARRRFDREAHLGARLNHANLRAVHDLGSHEGRPYMALSWVDTSLTELLEHAPGKRLEPEVACWLGIQCCAALGSAHANVDRTGQPHPIVHRDVSPGNILLTLDGHVLLADLTAPAGSPRASSLDVTPPDTHFFGNLGYAAPEALREEALDGRADVFSLGCVLYEALSGCPAFEGDDERSILFQVLEQGPLDLERRVPSLPEAVVRVVRRALERQVDRRYQSADEMRAALGECVQHVSAFCLEERTAAAIRQVLGERIRQREEAMHLAFQRFAPSQFERTDTLPIAGAGVERGDTTLGISGSERVEPASEARAAGSGGVVETTDRQPSWRERMWLLPLALLLIGGVVAFGSRWRLQRLEPSRPPTPHEVTTAPAVAQGAVARGQFELQPLPAERASVAEGSAAPGSGSNQPGAALAPGAGAAALQASAVGARVADVQTAAPLERAAARRQQTAEGRAATRVPAAATKPAAPAVAPGPPKAFVFDFPEGNPYEENAREHGRGVPKAPPPGNSSGAP